VRGHRLFLGKVDERPPGMRQAQRQRHGVALADAVVAAIGIDLQDAGKAVEMFERTAAFAVGRIDIGHRWRGGAAPRPVISRIGPELTRLRASGLRRRDHRHHRLVGKELGRALQGAHQMGVKRRQPPGGTAHPVGKDRALDVDALTRIDAGLAVQGAVIGVLRDHHLRHQRIARDPLVDDIARRRRLDDAGLVAAATAIARPLGDEHAELDGDNVEALGDILADHMKLAAAARTALVVDIDQLLDALEVGGQVPEVLPARLPGAGLGGGGLEPGLGARQCDLEILERQLKLIGIELLAAGAKLPALEHGEDLGDAPDLVLGGSHRILEFSNLAGQCVLRGLLLGQPRVLLGDLGSQRRNLRKKRIDVC